MTNTLKNIRSLVIILITVIFASCKSNNQSKNHFKTVNDNYIVLLDLSDRLLNTGQKEQDIAVILKAFNVFEQKAKQKLLMNCNDAFICKIIPQDKVKYNSQSFEKSLNFNFSEINSMNKNKEFNRFKNALPGLLDSLYDVAKYSNKHKDYAGTKTWKFFNEKLNYLLDTAAQNHVILLCDGYLDFESYASPKLAVKNRSVSSNFIRKLNTNSWKEIAEKENYGFMDINKNFASFDICVAGIKTKNNDYNEFDKLNYFWNKWLGAMNTNNVTLIPFSNQTEIVSELNL